MVRRTIHLELLPQRFAIAKLDAQSAVPDWAQSGGFSSVTRAESELSIVSEEALVPDNVTAERNYRCFRVAGPLDFSEIGILHSLTAPLAEAAISIFAVSTYETDYLFLPGDRMEDALSTLERCGHTIQRLSKSAPLQ